MRALALLVCLLAGAARAGVVPYVPPPPPPEDAPPPPPPPPEEAPAEPAAGAEVGAVTEEEVDFEEEEKKSDAQSNAIKAAAGGGGPPPGVGGPPASGDAGAGFKLFVDLLAISKLGQESFTILPNHTYVFLMAQIQPELAFIIHVSDAPIFFELQWDPLPGLTLKAGKLLIPFGTNEFHHIIGGRVDAQSLFLPETWSDFGVAMNHAPLDTEWFGFEYTLYAVNGFQGNEEPAIAAGTGTDNNYFKALGARPKLTLFSSFSIIGSAYFDFWDPEGKYKTLFYAIGGEARRGFIKLPVLDRFRLRGEWARGEIELPQRNLQKGLIGDYAIARTGFYGEVTGLIWETLSGRARFGRINSDNTQTLQKEDDAWMMEPGLIWWVFKNKVQLTLAYQMLFPAGRQLDGYDPFDPGDMAYGKIFLQF